MFNPDEDELSSLEARLRSWVPSPGSLDHDRMLFEAGRAEVQRPIQAGTRANLWKFATAAAVLLASGLGMAWHNERSQRRALELTIARLAAPPSVPLTPTPELIAKRQEKEPAVDPTSYLASGPAGESRWKTRQTSSRTEPHRAPSRASGQPTRRELHPCGPATGIG